MVAWVLLKLLNVDIMCRQYHVLFDSTLSVIAHSANEMTLPHSPAALQRIVSKLTSATSVV